ncbi:MAG: TonB-dependent receptor [Chitinophagaceae bacterium]|nr:TonB-dependent receptor [Polaromonas sp.]
MPRVKPALPTRRAFFAASSGLHATQLAAIVASSLALPGTVWGQTAPTPAISATPAVTTLAPVAVQGSRNSVLGEAGTANEGVITQQQLEARTTYRPGEVLEAVPGLVVSQHSGEGKANQFYLRGFNLDHGTDLRTTIDGMLVNQRSHAHGQGWSDVNFLIPELTSLLDYRKGPFYAAEGDFATAGAVSVKYANTLPKGIASVGVGQNGFARTFLADSPKLGDGNLLYAVELFHNNGPFTVGDNYNKRNAVLRYSQGTEANGLNVTLMAYQAKWHATDQIPLRAVQAGTLGRFDAVDQTDGGQSSRYSLSGAWRQASGNTQTLINAYVVRNKLDLYSNFTYFLDDPVNGDQFNQPDRRTTTGINASHLWAGQVMGRPSETTVGAQFQNDSISNGLYSTVARQVLSTTRADQIIERSLGLYVENKTEWTEKFRTVAGLRADNFYFKVASSDPANSGTASSTKVSPKLNLIFGPWNKTEFYASAGSGFHSNDARGTTITVEPKTGNPADKVPPLVRSRGFELGVRTEAIAGLQTAFSVYKLDFDSELTFAGDAGTTQAGRPSRRVGFELSNYYKVNRWLTIDADLAFAKARFRGFDPAGDRIPGAVEGVASLALAVDNLGPYFGALQLRYFGPRPLIEDNTVRSNSTATINARVGYKFSPQLKLELEGFNLTNAKSSAIDYYYVSQLKTETTPTADVHFHPIEKRSMRLTLTANF